ncbi:MAG: cation:proton antiporter [Chromatiaceae bacterium]|nr:cation:proton antiporter [Chromatiaceae bacterium]
MPQDAIVDTIFLVFTGAAVLATLALAARQSLLLAYIALGVLFGPSGIGLMEDASIASSISHIGIMFLLFLLGLDLHPQDLMQSVRRTTLVTLGGSLILAVAGLVIGLSVGFSFLESVVLGGAMTFSSTIIGLKLLPTTVLHHQRMGEIIISILLLQDVIAIAMLLLLRGAAIGGEPWTDVALMLLMLPALVLIGGLGARFVLIPLIKRFDTIREYVFLVAIGWCMGMAELGGLMGLSHEIGAFIAGVALASSPIAVYIADSLRPLRDFFLVLFFFSIGVQFELGMLMQVLVPAALVAGAALTLKPVVFRWLLTRIGDPAKRSLEIGYRLGQMSEFSMLIGALALELTVIGAQASYTIQLATVLTFLVSSYLVVKRFPTPIAVSDELRRD